MAEEPKLTLEQQRTLGELRDAIVACIAGEDFPPRLVLAEAAHA